MKMHSFGTAVQHIQMSLVSIIECDVTELLIAKERRCSSVSVCVSI